MLGTTTAQNIKESVQSDAQLHFYKNNFYVKTDSRIFLTLNLMTETVVSVQTQQSGISYTQNP